MRSRAHRVCVYAHKGGVGKTTAALCLARALTALGERVLLVDGDPQCNLTRAFFCDEVAMSLAYESRPSHNVYAALRPAMTGSPTPLSAVRCEERDGMFLLMGHPNLSLYETEVGMGLYLSLPTLANVVGSFDWLFGLTAESVGATYVVVDTGPSAGALNRVLVCASDSVYVPCVDDAFGVMSLESLATLAGTWLAWASERARVPAHYPYPSAQTKLAGVLCAGSCGSRVEETARGRLAAAFGVPGDDLPVLSLQKPGTQEHAEAFASVASALVASALTQTNSDEVIKVA